MKLRFFLLSLTILMSFTQILGQEIVLQEGRDKYDFNASNVLIFEEKGKSYSFSDVSSQSFADSFQLSKTGNYLNEKGKVYWVKFKIKNAGSSNNKWLVEFYDFHISKFDLFFPEYNRHVRTGYFLPFEDRSIVHKNFIDQIDIPQGQEILCYARVEIDIPSYLVATVRSLDEFIPYALREYFVLALYYGVILTLLLYNLVVYFITKDSTYLYYFLYLLSMGLLGMARDGLGFHFLWPDYPGINEYLLPISEYTMILFGSLYTIQFLKLQNRIPWIFKTIVAAILVRTALLVYALAFDYQLLYHQWYDLIPFSILFLAGVISARNKFKPARYFIIAFSILFIGFLTYILMDLRIIPFAFYTFYSMNFAVMGEVIFLSIAMSDQLKTASREATTAQQKVIQQLRENHFLKDKVNRELEEKVAERTLELQLKTLDLTQANKKLESLTKELNEMNARLDLANWNLNNQIKEKSKTIIFDKVISYEEFCSVFPDELSCYRHLEDIKWGKNYSCKKCGCKEFTEGDKKFSRKCTQCNNSESITAFTIFHNVRFPLLKAFYLVYTTAISDQNISMKQLSEMLTIRPNTCIDFRKKIEERMQRKLKNASKKKIEKWENLVLDF